MRDRAVLREALADGNVQAFLRAIREGESRQDDDGYRIRWGGLGRPPAYFDDFDDHPRVLEPTTGGRMSSAAGAYQATKTTWDEERAKWGWPDFSPGCQDEFAVARLIYRDALEDVKAGRFDAACAKCAAEWTSLPGGDEENAATRRARDTYVKWGGRFEPAAPQVFGKPEDLSESPDDWLRHERYGEAVTESTVQPQEDTMPSPILVPAAISIVTSLASALIEGFAPLAREKAAKALSKHTGDPAVADKVAGALVDAAKSVTGKADALAAVAAARDDPAIMARVEAEALDALAKLAPLLDKVAELDGRAWDAEEASRDAATKRAQLEAHDQDPFLTRSVVFGAFGILTAAAILTAILAHFGKSTGELIGLITTGAGMILGAFKTRIDHRYGSSRSSGAKDIVIDELARRRATSK